MYGEFLNEKRTSVTFSNCVMDDPDRVNKLLAKLDHHAKMTMRFQHTPLTEKKYQKDVQAAIHARDFLKLPHRWTTTAVLQVCELLHQNCFEDELETEDEEMAAHRRSVSYVSGVIAACRDFQKKEGNQAAWKAWHSLAVDKWRNGLGHLYGKGAKARKLGFTDEQIARLLAKHAQKLGLVSSRTAATIAFLFQSMRRIGDVRRTMAKDVTLVDPHTLRVVLHFGKSDPFGEGQEVFIEDGPQPHNAFKWVKGLWESKPWMPEERFFAIRSAVCEAIKKFCDGEPDLDAKDYSAHSLRRGGAHNAAVKGVSTSAVKAQGGWRSDQVELYTSLSGREAAHLTNV